MTFRGNRGGGYYPFRVGYALTLYFRYLEGEIIQFRRVPASMDIDKGAAIWGWALNRLQERWAEVKLPTNNPNRSYNLTPAVSAETRTCPCAAIIHTEQDKKKKRQSRFFKSSQKRSGVCILSRFGGSCAPLSLLRSRDFRSFFFVFALLAQGGKIHVLCCITSYSGLSYSFLVRKRCCWRKYNKYFSSRETKTSPPQLEHLPRCDTFGTGQCRR